MYYRAKCWNLRFQHFHLRGKVLCPPSWFRTWYPAAVQLGTDGHLYLIIHLLHDFLHREYIGKAAIRAEQVPVAARENVARLQIPLSKPALKTWLRSGHNLYNHSSVNTNHFLHIVRHNHIQIVHETLGPIYNLWNIFYIIFVTSSVRISFVKLPSAWNHRATL